MVLMLSTHQTFCAPQYQLMAGGGDSCIKSNPEQALQVVGKCDKPLQRTIVANQTITVVVKGKLDATAYDEFTIGLGGCNVIVLLTGNQDRTSFIFSNSSGPNLGNTFTIRAAINSQPVVVASSVGIQHTLDCKIKVVNGSTSFSFQNPKDLTGLDIQLNVPIYAKPEVEEGSSNTIILVVAVIAILLLVLVIGLALAYKFLYKRWKKAKSDPKDDKDVSKGKAKDGAKSGEKVKKDDDENGQAPTKDDQSKMTDQSRFTEKTDKPEDEASTKK